MAPVPTFVPEKEKGISEGLPGLWASHSDTPPSQPCPAQILQCSQVPPTPAMPKPCQPRCGQAPCPAVPQPNPASLSQAPTQFPLYPHPVPRQVPPIRPPTRRVSHLGPAGGVCGGGGRLGRLMLKGGNCHRESKPRTRPSADTPRHPHSQQLALTGDRGTPRSAGTHTTSGPSASTTFLLVGTLTPVLSQVYLGRDPVNSIRSL